MRHRQLIVSHVTKVSQEASKAADIVATSRVLVTRLVCHLQLAPFSNDDDEGEP